MLPWLGQDTPAADSRCSFCDRLGSEERRLIGCGKRGAYICAECVTVCQETLNDTRRAPPTTSISGSAGCAIPSSACSATTPSCRWHSTRSKKVSSSSVPSTSRPSPGRGRPRRDPRRRCNSAAPRPSAGPHAAAVLQFGRDSDIAYPCWQDPWPQPAAAGGRPARFGRRPSASRSASGARAPGSVQGAAGGSGCRRAARRSRTWK